MKNFCFKTEQTIRLDEFLRKNLSLQISNENFSNSKLRRLILAGAVFVNGKQIRRPAFELRGKSTVCVEYDEENEEYVVEGPKIEKMLGYTNLESEKGFVFFQKFLKETGILDELEKLGIQEGDTVRMYGLIFQYYK